jgi:hydroxyethylthiazole kinase-like uncharacterized protein yjeF
VVLLVGAGANGGDALFAGARLARRGAGVVAVPLAPGREHPGGPAALLAAGGRVEPAESAEGAEEASGDSGSRGTSGTGASGASGGGGSGDTAAAPVNPGALHAIARADLVLDGVTGIGGKGGLRPTAAALARAAAGARAAVVAVDLPSGVEADSGEVRGDAVRADLTVTFGTYKAGLLIDPAAALAGAVRLVDIGLGPHLAAAPVALEALQHADVAALLPRPGGESDKYRRGVVGVVAGSARYPGAAVLAVAGALHGGAGAVRYVGRGGDAVLARFPETLVSSGPPGEAGRVQAWVVGPGLGEGPEARAAVAEVLAAEVPVLVDADGLSLAGRDALRERGERGAPTVITPHAGEAARLLGTEAAEVEAARLASVRRLAAELHVTALLKGSTTLVAAPDAAVPVRANPTGTAWLATAGSGDVLSGLTGSLLAAGLAPRDAASAGAYLHGLAARLSPTAGAPLTATDVAALLPRAWLSITGD